MSADMCQYLCAVASCTDIMHSIRLLSLYWPKLYNMFLYIKDCLYLNFEGTCIIFSNTSTSTQIHTCLRFPALTHPLPSKKGCSVDVQGCWEQVNTQIQDWGYYRTKAETLQADLQDCSSSKLNKSMGLSISMITSHEWGFSVHMVPLLNLS